MVRVSGCTVTRGTCPLLEEYLGGCCGDLGARTLVAAKCGSNVDRRLAGSTSPIYWNKGLRCRLLLLRPNEDGLTRVPADWQKTPAAEP